MNKLCCAAICLSAVVLHAKGEHLSPEERYARTGGNVIVPSNGKVTLANSQDLVDAVTLNVKAKEIADLIRLNVKVENSPFSFASAAASGRFTVYIIDDKDMPRTLVAPDGFWGVANVSGLTKERAEREIMRTTWFVLGAGYPLGDGGVLSVMKGDKDLDEIKNDKPELQQIVNMMNYFNKLGIKPSMGMTYKRACRLGVAPAPTNDVQKAIWDEIHTPPSKPLKITYDKDRQKPVVK